jgi:hypothetical protein
MGRDQWYELRVEGSAGTSAGNSQGATDGIAIARSGRLCSLTSGEARKFESRQLASAYLGTAALPGNYRFEIVPCRRRNRAAA